MGRYLILSLKPGCEFTKYGSKISEFNVPYSVNLGQNVEIILLFASGHRYE